MSIPDSKLQTFGKIGIRSKNVATLIADFCHALVVTVNYSSLLGPVGTSDDDEDRDGDRQCQLKGQILAKFLGLEHSPVTNFSSDCAAILPTH